jgi:hypothetical protein
MRLLQLGAELVRTLDLASDVIADVSYSRGLHVSGKECVEVGDTESFCRRHLEYPAGVVQGARADPADAILDGVENRQQVSAFQAVGSH